MSKSIGKMAGSNYATQEDYDRYLSDFIRNNPSPYNEGVQYAQNNSGNIATDAQYVNNPNYISDEDLLAIMWSNVKQNEGNPLNPYLDTKGTITVGAGSNINSKEDFMKVNFMIGGRPATDAEKEQYYSHLRDISMLVDENNNFIYHSYKPDYFKKETPLLISDDESYRLAQNHMSSDLAHVRQEFADFDTFPLPLKEVLLDIQYNTENLTQKAWPHLYGAIERRDVFGEDGIVNNVGRKDIHEERREWTDKKAKSIRF